MSEKTTLAAALDQGLRAMMEMSARLWCAQYFWQRAAIDGSADPEKLGEHPQMLSSRLAAQRFVAHEKAFMDLAAEHGQDGRAVIEQMPAGTLLKLTSTAAHGMAFSHDEAAAYVGAEIDTAEDLLKQLRHIKREA